MKITKLLLIAAATLLLSVTSRGQDFSALTHATNYTAVGYITHFEANNRTGGGAMALYNFNGYTGAGVGADWAGQWRLFSANVNVHYSYQLTDKLSLTGYGLAALGAASGAQGDSGTLASGEGAGAYLSYRLTKHSVGLGGNYLTRQNCGHFSGGSEAITVFYSF